MTKDKNENKQFNVALPADLIRRVRIYTASTGKTKIDVTKEALEAFLSDKQIPGE